jgi:hypothetical protein
VAYRQLECTNPTIVRPPKKSTINHFHNQLSHPYASNLDLQVFKTYPSENGQPHPNRPPPKRHRSRNHSRLPHREFLPFSPLLSSHPRLTNPTPTPQSAFISLNSKCPVTGTELPTCATQTAAFDAQCCGSISAFGSSLVSCYESNAPKCLDLSGIFPLSLSLHTSTQNKLTSQPSPNPSPNSAPPPQATYLTATPARNSPA